MSRKKWNKVAAGVMVTVLALANSITVFAYRDVQQGIVPEGSSQEEIEKVLNRDSFMFIPDEAGQEEEQNFVALEESEILYDSQFIDEEGNIYPITDPVQRGCSHDYVSGTIKDHKKFSDGSCEERYFRGQRCSKCGTVVYGDLIKTITYTVCPH